MATAVFDEEVTNTLRTLQDEARRETAKTVTLDSGKVTIPTPFPSPIDWRDMTIYFLMLDRFNHPGAPPASGRWDREFDRRQGGTFRGVQEQLGYLQELGVNAIWMSPIVKNPHPDFAYSYTGYQAQDFLNIDPRFASDGTGETAERELTDLVDEAHARGMYIIVDIVLNHAARVFDYVLNGQDVPDFGDPSIMHAPLGAEPPIRWLDGAGVPEQPWQPDLPPAANLTPDDGVWPVDLQRKEFFRRRGHVLSHKVTNGFVPGDFGDMRQLVAEYVADQPEQAELRKVYGPYPVLEILVRAYSYMIARYDIDAFRIDSVKYIDPAIVCTFGNAIREFALSAGKKNFFMFGEIYDQEDIVNRFVGRDATTGEGFGIDAALDFPLFFKLPAVVKGMMGVEAIRLAIEARKQAEKTQISSHGQAGQYFVTFLDNHDQHERFRHPDTPEAQVTMGLAALYCLQGIPCIYYGTEQGLTGATNDDGQPALETAESVREALWGKPNAFDRNHPLYQDIRTLTHLRKHEPALRYGRIYPREVSGNGVDFGHSSGTGGILAFTRVLWDQEVLCVANTNIQQPWEGDILLDVDLHRRATPLRIRYSNMGTGGDVPVSVHSANIGGSPTEIASVHVKLQSMEIQVLTP
jgi:glycosidase